MTTIKTLISRFNAAYFFSIPPETQIVYFWFVCFVLLLATTFVVYLVFRTRGIQEKPYRRFAKNFFWPNFILSLMGLFLTFSRYEKLALLSYRFWVYFTILVTLVFNAWYFIVKQNQLEDELLKYHNAERKAKWMNTSNNAKHKTKK